MERCSGHFTVPTYNAFGILSESTDSDEHASYNDQPVVPATKYDIDTACTCDADSSFSIRDGVLPSSLDESSRIANITDFVFKSKSLHIANLILGIFYRNSTNYVYQWLPKKVLTYLESVKHF